MNPSVGTFPTSRRISAVPGRLAACGVALLLCVTGVQAAQEPSQPLPAASHGRVPMSGLDALIEHLHANLRITAAQEPLWHKVAAAMRESAQTMNRLVVERAEHARTATAVEDLRSYWRISEAHAVESKKLLTTFEALYDTMSPAQKRIADAEFRDHYREHRPAPRKG